MTNTRFRNFSSARRCHNLSSRKRKEKKKPRQRESYSSSSSYVSSLRGVFDLFYTKTYRSRTRVAHIDVTVQRRQFRKSIYKTHTKGTEWVFRFLGLFLSFFLTISTIGKHHTPSRYGGDLSIFPPLSIKLPNILYPFLIVSQKY